MTTTATAASATSTQIHALLPPLLDDTGEGEIEGAAEVVTGGLVAGTTGTIVIGGRVGGCVVGGSVVGGSVVGGG